MTTPSPEGIPNSVPESLVYRITDIVQRMSLETLFPERQPVHVELGAGDGSFMAVYAQKHPELNFLAVERLLGRLRKLNRKGQRAGLKNLKLVSIEAAYLVRYLLPAESIEALHVYFPDPWPKRRHWKHRLIQANFVEHAYQCLKQGGVVYLRTDDGPYFQQMLEVFGADARFKVVETPEELASVVTDFERGFNQRGVQTRRAAFKKV